MMRPVWEAAGGRDGFISLEVEADLAFDGEGTVRARARDAGAGRPPEPDGQGAGHGARRRGVPPADPDGVNINVTLLFGVARYREIAEAYIEASRRASPPASRSTRIDSVASFFVSRIDSKVDAKLPEGSPLRGKIAIANAKVAYADVYRRGLRRRRAGSGWRRRREPAAAAVGVDVDEEPGLPGDPLRRRADRARHGQHRARRDARRLPRGRPRRRARSTGTWTRPAPSSPALADAGIDLDEITDELEPKA